MERAGSAHLCKSGRSSCERVRRVWWRKKELERNACALKRVSQKGRWQTS